MTDAPGINRISLRIPADLFLRLDDKRHFERTTFQDVGLRLFREWLEGKHPAPSAGHEALSKSDAAQVQKLIQILTSGDDETIAAAKANMDLFFDRLRPKAKR